MHKRRRACLGAPPAMGDVSSGRLGSVHLPAVTPAEEGWGRGDGELRCPEGSRQVNALSWRRDRSASGCLGCEVWLGGRRARPKQGGRSQPALAADRPPYAAIGACSASPVVVGWRACCQTRTVAEARAVRTPPEPKVDNEPNWPYNKHQEVKCEHENDHRIGRRRWRTCGCQRTPPQVATRA